MKKGQLFPEELKKDTRLIREKYEEDCLAAAYELKTYFASNRINSATIVLKMRPRENDEGAFSFMNVPEDGATEPHPFIYHAIEVYEDTDGYYVYDILFRDEPVQLKQYLDELCSVNECKNTDLRYDMGLLSSAHAYAKNMSGLTRLMTYLDKVYCVGKPRLNVMFSEPGEENLLLSDDIVLCPDEMFPKTGYSKDELYAEFSRVYGLVCGMRFNMLAVFAKMSEWGGPLINKGKTDMLFDDSFIMEMMKGAEEDPDIKMRSC